MNRGAGCGRVQDTSLADPGRICYDTGRIRCGSNLHSLGRGWLRDRESDRSGLLRRPDRPVGRGPPRGDPGPVPPDPRGGSARGRVGGTAPLGPGAPSGCPFGHRGRSFATAPRLRSSPPSDPRGWASCQISSGHGLVRAGRCASSRGHRERDDCAIRWPNSFPPNRSASAPAGRAGQWSVGAGPHGRGRAPRGRICSATRARQSPPRAGTLGGLGCSCPRSGLVESAGNGRAASRGDRPARPGRSGDGRYGPSQRSDRLP